uniref:Putative secreted protein n=1 Tax=Anopheles triannulatus TaxID=58253 RepID=A0A2M4B1F0_9DIPT
MGSIIQLCSIMLCVRVCMCVLCLQSMWCACVRVNCMIKIVSPVSHHFGCASCSASLFPAPQPASQRTNKEKNKQRVFQWFFLCKCRSYSFFV